MAPQRIRAFGILFLISLVLLFMFALSSMDKNKSKDAFTSEPAYYEGFPSDDDDPDMDKGRQGSSARKKIEKAQSEQPQEHQDDGFLPINKSETHDDGLDDKDLDTDDDE